MPDCTRSGQFCWMSAAKSSMCAAALGGFGRTSYRRFGRPTLAWKRAAPAMASASQMDACTSAVAVAVSASSGAFGNCVFRMCSFTCRMQSAQRGLVSTRGGPKQPFRGHARSRL
jgi:hypothetical protein